MPLSDGTIAYFPFAVIDATGAIVRIGKAEFSLIGLQAVDAGEVVVSPIPEAISGVIVADVDGVEDDTHYWDGTDWQGYPARPPGDAYWDGSAWQVRPDPPNAYTIWDGTEWVDPRTETDRANQLHQARLATSIPTTELFIRLATYGAFPMAEVANYAFPPTVDEFLELPAFTAEQHDLIKGGLKSWATISRAETRIFGPIHPDDPGDGLPYFIPWLASEKSITITEAQADEMFGVPVPPPLYTAP